MRICVLIDAWEPIWGGGQTHVWELSNYLAALGNEVDIFTRALTLPSERRFIDKRNVVNNNIRLFKIGPLSEFFHPLARTVWNAQVIFSILKEHKTKPYDVIHAHSILPAIPGKLVSILVHKPIVFTVHGSPLIDRKLKTVSALIERFILTKFQYDALISVSRKFLLYRNRAKAGYFIPNGVSTNLFSVPKKPTSDPKYLKLLWVGRFDEVKGIDILLRAFAKVIVESTNYRLTLVGYGYEIEKYKKMIKTLKLERFVSIVGKKKQRELKEFYKNHLVFILPSLAEGMPITLLEAWANGLPVVATDVGDNHLWVKSGKNGFLIKPKSESELIEALRKLQKISSSKLYRMGLSGQDLVKRKCSWAKIATQTLHIYTQLLYRHN